jgi:hypothetical protein
VDQTSFDGIRRLAKLNFGSDPGAYQVRLWWFGAGRSARGDFVERRRWPEKEIGPWEVVIRLAIRYTRETVVKSGKRWSDRQSWSFIYWILWESPQQRLEKMVGSRGEFMAPTFWAWAAERRKSEEPTIGKKAKRDFVKALKNALESMEDEFEEAT